MIYPVPIKYWFSNKNSPFHEDYELIKRKLPGLRCKNCGGKITLNTGYVSHGFAYGYQDDNYCTLRCMKEFVKKQEIIHRTM